MSIVEDIGVQLDGFAGISLKEISKASLMRRKDSKYLFQVGILPRLLEEVRDHYAVLEIDSLRAHNYETTYFDTADFAMYMMHHNGRVNRHKVRMRRYGSSDDVFLEVKKKDARGITSKNRVQTREAESRVLSTEEEFLSEYTPYHFDRISPVLRNNFKRITLVSKDQKERITLDFSLWFDSLVSDSSMELPGVSIAEIKYESTLKNSVFHAALRKASVTPRRFSKYCMGMALLNPDLKQNVFKEKLRYMMKLNVNYLQHQIEHAYA